MPNESTRQPDHIDLSSALTSVITDIVRHTPSLAHIDVDRVLVCIGSNRRHGRGGLYGKLVPLRFENGSSRTVHRGRTYGIPEISHRGRTCLYVLYFFMPRFFDLSWDDKLGVIFHELFHISPRFDGDIRRMATVRIAHGHSKRHFDSLFSSDLLSYIPHARKSLHYDFLKMNSTGLYRRYGAVTAIRMKNPRPVPLNPE
ncbi:MAG: hypothetical protein JW838_04730 [Spirochaetes bacterium]|nr:hypothetical protein [Spirochaetota bacterium]